MPSAPPEPHPHDDDRSDRGSRRITLIAVGVVAIAALVGGSLWMAMRLARDVTAAGEQQRSTLQQDLNLAVSEGREQARIESQMLASTGSAAAAPPADDGVSDSDRADWSSYVSTFVVRELINPASLAESRGDGHFDVVAELHDAVRTLDASLGVHPAAEAGIRMIISTSYFQHAAYDDAAVQAERALDIMQRTFGDDHRYTRHAMRNLGIIRLYQRRVTDAVDLLDRLAAIRLAVLGESHVDTQRTVALVSLVRAHAAEIETAPPDATSPVPAELESWFNLNYTCCTVRPLDY